MPRRAAGPEASRRLVPVNQLEVLVDGAEALPRIADEIERARSHVWIAGWHFDPDFRLRGEGPTLRELLAEAAERVEVRVLAWAGAPLPLFHPDRGEVRDVRRTLTAGTRICCALDARERPLHCHHEKLVLVDGETAFVGGIDLTTLAGDRFDPAGHPQRPKLGWHDATTRLHGPGASPMWPTTSVSAGTKSPARALPGRRSAGACRQPRCPDRPDRAREGLRRSPEGRLSDPRELPPGAPLSRAARLSREPVPLVAGDRRRARRQAAQPSD